MITALSPEPLAEVANIMIPAKVHNRQPILRRGRLKELDALPVYASQAL